MTLRRCPDQFAPEARVGAATPTCCCCCCLGVTVASAIALPRLIDQAADLDGGPRRRGFRWLATVPSMLSVPYVLLLILTLLASEESFDDLPVTVHPMAAAAAALLLVLAAAMLAGVRRARTFTIVGLRSVTVLAFWVLEAVIAWHWLIFGAHLGHVGLGPIIGADAGETAGLLVSVLLAALVAGWATFRFLSRGLGQRHRPKQP